MATLSPSSETPTNASKLDADPHQTHRTKHRPPHQLHTKRIQRSRNRTEEDSDPRRCHGNGILTWGSRHLKQDEHADWVPSLPQTFLTALGFQRQESRGFRFQITGPARKQWTMEFVLAILSGNGRARSPRYPK
jgi:hypothetical protein